MSKLYDDDDDDDNDVELALYRLPTLPAVPVLGKNIWGAWPSSFGRQQRLSKITIEPIKKSGGNFH